MRTDLPAAAQVAPADGPRNRGRPARDDLDGAQTGGFDRHLSLAAESARARKPDTAQDGRAPGVHWQGRPNPLSGEEPQPPPLQQQPAGEIAGGTAVDPTLIADTGSVGVAAGADQPSLLAALGAGAIQTRAPAQPARIGDPPRPGSGAGDSRLLSAPPAGRHVAPVAVADILVVGRETHLAPAVVPRAAPVALGDGGGSPSLPPADASLYAGAADANPDAAPPSLAPAQGGDRGQWFAQGFSGRPAADGGPQGRDFTSGDPVADFGATHRATTPAGDTAALAPQLPTTPARQIADRIAAHVAGGEPSRADPASPLSNVAAAHPLKVLTIQLHPAELGAVTVRIALLNDALELQIETGRRETARLLDADRDTLSALLRSAGYGVDALTVRAVEPSNAGATAGWPTSSAQSNSGGAQPDAGSSGGRAQAEQDGGFHRARRDGNDEPGGSRHRAGDGLYV
jgi:hypothetical protein